MIYLVKVFRSFKCLNINSLHFFVKSMILPSPNIGSFENGYSTARYVSIEMRRFFQKNLVKILLHCRFTIWLVNPDSVL